MIKGQQQITSDWLLTGYPQMLRHFAKPGNVKRHLKGENSMTLIVSEVSKFGIAMAADSAITEIYPSSWVLASGVTAPSTVRTGAQKLLPIKAINAAISFWGFGTVGTPDNLNARIPMDQFLSDFADSVGEDASLEDVGNQLADLVNSRIRVGKVRGGFHLAGYTQESGKLFPALYHIHTGHKPEGPHGSLKLYRDYPFGIGKNVDQWLRELQTTPFYLRNGLYDTYAYFSYYLNKLMERLQQEKNFICPDYSRFPTGLEARGRFLKLQIQTICEFYRLSNRLETIAMPISWITISPNGIEHVEPVVI